MSEAQQIPIIEQKIMYSQPPKEPENVVGLVIDVNAERIEVEHLSGAKNSIPITWSYTIVEPTTPLTGAPIFKKFTQNGMLFEKNGIVSYTIKSHPGLLIGRIVKLIYDKDGNHLLLLEHLNNVQKTILIKQNGLTLAVGNPDLTVYPEAQPVQVPYIVGHVVSYSLVGVEGVVIGKIIGINTNLEGTTFTIEHLDGNKIMTYKKGEDFIGKFTIVEAITPLTNKPIKPIVPIKTEDYKVNDSVSFRLNKMLKQGIISKINLKNKPPLITVNFLDGTNVNIPYNQPELQKIVAGHKKYTLEDENKYRLKYAKYKAKYLLLK